MILGAFYLAIMERITSNVSDVKYFDLWCNQLDAADPEKEDDYPFPFPAVFLEYDPMEFQTLGGKKQATNATFSLRVYSEVLQETSNLESTTERNMGLHHLSLLDEIFKYMQGYSGEGFGSISRTNIEPDHNYTGIKGDVMIFRVRLTDTAAMPVKENLSNVPQGITAEIVKREDEE